MTLDDDAGPRAYSSGPKAYLDATERLSEAYARAFILVGDDYKGI